MKINTTFALNDEDRKAIALWYKLTEEKADYTWCRLFVRLYGFTGMNRIVHQMNSGQEIDVAIRSTK